MKTSMFIAVLLVLALHGCNKKDDLIQPEPPHYGPAQYFLKTSWKGQYTDSVHFYNWSQADQSVSANFYPLIFTFKKKPDRSMQYKVVRTLKAEDEVFISGSDGIYSVDSQFIQVNVAADGIHFHGEDITVVWPAGAWAIFGASDETYDYTFDFIDK